MENIRVVDVMTRNPYTVLPDTSLFDCAKQMVRKQVNSLSIVDKKKKLVGFISQKDILWALIKKKNTNVLKIKAIDISPKKVATIKPNASIKDAIEKMNRLKFDKLPVVQNDELIGIITVRDVLSFQPEIYPEFEEYSKVRQEQEKMNRISLAKERHVVTDDGICEECGEVSTLYRANGMLLCGFCASSA